MIDSCKKKSEKVAAYTEQSTANFEKITNITVNNDNLIPQKNKMGVSKIIRKIVKFLTEKMSQIRVLKKSRKIIEQNVSERIDFKGYLNNMIQETNLLTTMLGKSITRNLMTGTSAQVPLST